VEAHKTLSRLASTHEVHPTRITLWENQLLDGGRGLFGPQHVREQQAQTARAAELFVQIGRLVIELVDMAHGSKGEGLTVDE
jgi:hypothetical protein